MVTLRTHSIFQMIFNFYLLPLPLPLPLQILLHSINAIISLSHSLAFSLEEDLTVRPISHYISVLLKLFLDRSTVAASCL